MKPELENIWNEFAGKLRQFIRGRVTDGVEAEDLLQDVFAKLQSRLDEIRDPAKLRGWLFLVARNAIIDHYRTRKDTSPLTESLPADVWEHETEAKELNRVFHQILNSLPAPYREALILTQFEGLTQQELAKRLGISVSGAKSRVQRGREQLKELLLEYCHREFSRFGGDQLCPKGLLPVVRGAKPNRPENQESIGRKDAGRAYGKQKESRQTRRQ
jgi:RNA polymerase sigma-70 factor, ECF subfamily